MADKASKERMSLYQKLLAFQEEVSGVKKEKNNPFFNSAYFDINALLAAVKPSLNKHKLILLQPLGYIDSKLALNTIIVDAESGESVSWATLLPDQPDAQKMGSVITYFRRYALQSMLGLEAEDDDGNAARKVPAKAPIKSNKPIAKVVDTEKPPFGEGANDGKLDDILG